MQHNHVTGFTRNDFTRIFYPYIRRITRGSGILPGTMLAMAILESSGKVGGQWLVGGSTLSRKANNYFGIKCGKDWTGRKYYIDTGEQRPDGSHYTDYNACFRSYRSVEHSMRDYIRFLQSNPRYRNVFNQKTVYDQASALKAAGYATANDYAGTVYRVYLSQKSIIDALNRKNNTFAISGIVVAVTGTALLIINSTHNEKSTQRLL